MKRKITHIIICLLTVFVLSACGTSTSSLEKEVKDLANKQMKGTGVRATDVTFIHQ